MVSLILIILYAICRSAIDTLLFHFYTSIFNNYNHRWWDPSISWRNKYISGDPSKGLKYKFPISFFIFFTDAFHLFNSLSLCLVFTAVVLYNPLTHIYLDVVIYGVGYNVIFELFFSKIFTKKKV